jgi:hypothetical protein
VVGTPSALQNAEVTHTYSMHKNNLLSSNDCNTWNSAWKKEHKLQAPENVVTKKMFGPKKVEVIG